MAAAREWWRVGVIYQVYPRSFQDRDGDGVGDLAGLRQRLDHLVALGVDAVWLSPIYPSPMADFGYDVADYCGVDPIFGTLADLDALVADAHARGLRVILDVVPNHSSDRHPWFLESRASRTNPKRDWYLWRDPAADGGPPNNWTSQFGGPAWTFDERTGQYYAHAFLPQQPDLNWRHPAVRAAVFDAMRFWLARGIDGFRVDVIYHLVKDAAFRDNPLNPDWREGDDPTQRLLPRHTIDQPEVQPIVAAMRRVLDEYSSPGRERVLIGEVYLPIARLVAYYGAAGDGTLVGAQLPFNFHLIGARWEAPAIDALIREYDAALPEGAQPNWVLGNHDKPRLASRVGEAQARVAAMLLLTLRGTPTIYQGEELGLVDVAIAPHEVQDPFERRVPGRGLGRDPQRTPMPWDEAPHGGFTTGRPWLPLGDANLARHAARQQRDPRSMLALYRTLLALRRAHPALHAGSIEPLGAQGGVLAYRRRFGDACWLVLLNLTHEPAALAPAWRDEAQPAIAAWSTGDDVSLRDPPTAATLAADEGRLLQLPKGPPTR